MHSVEHWSKVHPQQKCKVWWLPSAAMPIIHYTTYLCTMYICIYGVCHAQECNYHACDVSMLNYHTRAQHGTLQMQPPPPGPSNSIYRGTMYTAECHKSLWECITKLLGVCHAEHYSTSLRSRPLTIEGGSKSPRPTDFDEYLADAWGKLHQYNGVALLWVPRSVFVALWVT